MDGNSFPSLAQRTCAQCKSSKKKCDKILPKCSRCSRLSIDCVYSDIDKQNGSDAGQDSADARFEEVFRRLQKLETHVFPAGANGHELTPQERLLAIRAEPQGLEKPTSAHWAVNPGNLKPSFMSAVLWGSVFRVLEEHDTTIQEIGSHYFKQTDLWLPMVSRPKFEKALADFEESNIHDTFLLLILAMHIVITPAAEHPAAASLEESSWYRACKFQFAQYVALSEPSIELIQAGMLIAVFEYIQNIGERAITTLGICSRLAYVLEMDEAVAKQSSLKPGETSPEDEELVLTWWGLSRLDRYFNMPPLAFPKQSSIPLQAYKDGIMCGRVWQGPPTTGFSTIEPEILDACIMELDAAVKLGRVQAFIRDNRSQPAVSIADGVRVLQKEIQEHLIILRIKMRQSGSWAGIAVTAGAGLQLQCFHVEKQGSLDPDSSRSIHSYIGQVRDVISQCRTFNGFTENYLEGIQPTWCSVPYQALGAYRALRAADTQRTLPEIDTTVCLEALQIMAPRYKFAEKCLQLLDLA